MNSTNSDIQNKGRTVKSSKRSCLQVGFLLIFSILFILSNSLWIFTFNVQRVVFNPETLKSVVVEHLDSNIVFQRSISSMSNDEGTNTNSDQNFYLETLFSVLSPENKTAVQELLLPDLFVESLVTNSIEAFLAWVDTEDSTLQIYWDMTPLKNRLAGAEGQEAMRIAISSLPDCTPEEMNNIITQFITNPSAPLNSDRLCRFTEPYERQQEQIFNSALAAVNAEISPTYIVTPIQEDMGNAGSMRLIKGGLGFIRSYGRWGWLVSLSLLGLILLVGVRSMDTLSGWVGIPLLVSGILVLAFAVISRGWILFRLTSILTSNPSFFIADIINDFLKGISDGILQPIMIHGIILFVIGGVLIVILLIKRIIKAK